MNKEFEVAIKQLNSEQLRAVRTIDGPLLVIAGPGTGKTQLVGARVGYILKNTDTPASSILLLTFTEAGAQAMRDRLDSLVGDAAYDVQINTYHGFGGEVFKRYPDYFESYQLKLVEELGADSILREIISKLPYSNPLKFADSYVSDIKSFISDSKRALLSSEDICSIAKSNVDFIDEINKSSKKILLKLAYVSKKSILLFEELLSVLGSAKVRDPLKNIQSVKRYAYEELEAAIESFRQTGKTTEVSLWKRSWLERDANGVFVFSGKRQNERLKAAADIYDKYQKILSKQSLYDYDDMILRAIETLETNPQLKYSLAERYSYIMLDEFQDTNPAQFKLVKLLSDHPVHEGRPNIMAVGDDDQAIYSFQGAEQANMANFIDHYKGVKIISLKENYRSSPEIIYVSHKIRAKLKTGLQAELKNINKQQSVASENLSRLSVLEMYEFKTDVSQYSWLASQIKELVREGVEPKDIAVLAPKHRYLEPLVPYVSRLNVSINYERRENILDDPVVHQLVQMSRLITALSSNNEVLANHLWPEVLSYQFWGISTEKIWRVAWQAKSSEEPWTAILLNDLRLKSIASFFLELSSLLSLTTLEDQLDYLIGVPAEITEEEDKTVNLKYHSPMYGYYFAGGSKSQKSYDFIRLVSNLSVIRQRLREWYRTKDDRIGLRAFVEFVDGHRAAGLNIINTSPYYDDPDSVNLLTAYGAKGREFKAVFLIAASDEVWGSTSRNQGYRLSLPPNLSFIRYQGASEDERLRLLFVAITRAKTNLYITSYRHELSGKEMTRLRYLDLMVEKNGNLITDVFPKSKKIVIEDKKDRPSLQEIANYWTIRHQPSLSARLKDVLKPKLQRYALNPTDLIRFLDVVNGGPERFFTESLLGFPRAPSETALFGTAIHNTLRSAGVILSRDDRKVGEEEFLEIFKSQLSRIDLAGEEYQIMLNRGSGALRTWLSQKVMELNTSDRFEYAFGREGVVLGAARLSGKIDRLIINEKKRNITVLDYKIGRAYNRWQNGVIKLHQFRQQLLMYKLIVEGSRRYSRYIVNKGLIEFVEPDKEGIIRDLELEFNDQELENFHQLISAVWHRIQKLDFPDVSKYPATLSGIKQFEKDLIKTTG